MHPVRKSRGVRQFAFERLDERVCLSLDTSFVNGVLTITGSDEADTIVIHDNMQGKVVVDDPDSERPLVPFEGVQKIVVDSLGGDDTIRFHSRYEGSGRPGRSGDLPQPIDLEVNSGEGDDNVLIGLLLPAVQKVRDAAARAKVDVDLGGGNDRLRLNSHGIEDTELDIAAGAGDDQVLIGLLLPAVQKVRDAAARADMNVDLGAGNDRLRVNSNGIVDTTLDVTAGEGDDDVLIGLLVPAVQKVRDAAARADVEVHLGAGNNRLRVNSNGIVDTTLDVTAGEGDDDVAIGLLVPAVQKVRDAAARIDVKLGAGDDLLRIRGSGIEHTTLDITAGEGNDEILIGLLLPAVQKVRDAAARANVIADLGDGHDRFVMHAAGVENVVTDVTAGEGDDEILIGLLLPAVQKVRESAANIEVDLGRGSDTLLLKTRNYDVVETDISGDDEPGDSVTLDIGPNRRPDRNPRQPPRRGRG